MKSYVINGGKPLCGSIEINGSKNAALPILAASVLADGECRIQNVPTLSDIENLCGLLSLLGCRADLKNGVCSTNPSKLKSDVMYDDIATKFRASFLIAGPILAKTGRVKISMPGGCQIGARPIDLHIKGLAAMGAEIKQGHGYIVAKCKKLCGAEIYLDFPSVGATENLIMAAALAEGDTVIGNAAAEPEVANLADFINSMGGSVEGAGTDTVRVTGKKSLGGADFKVIPDRIEAGTFAIAAAATGGSVLIKNIVTEHLKPVIAKLEECGINTESGADSLFINAENRAKAADIKTMPYPGFPTDLQAPYTALMAGASGTSMVVETIFENRFMHVPELSRMGASIKIDGRTAVVEGKEKLSGAKVKATDLRAGASLTVAGLMACGETVVENVEHIERGYSNFAERLSSLNASVRTVNS